MRCGTCGGDNREGARFCDTCGAALGGSTSSVGGRRPETPSVPLPETLGGGRYRVTGVLGEGARKWVYRAVDARLEREVAVAVVKTGALDDETRRRIEREARSTARLGDHPLIVTVHDVGDDDGRPYIVSQLMPGGSIADLLLEAPQGRLAIADVLRIGEQVATALAHAHTHAVVHRDLKPANVWLTADGTAQLGDFGLAVPIDQSRLTAEGLVVGTVAYLAPEQALGHVPDGRADLYSLGAMLYEMVCGRPPFLGDDAVSIISQHLNTPPIAPSWHRSDVPPALEQLVVALLSKRPEDRPDTATKVAAELRRVRDELDQTPVGAKHIDDAERVRGALPPIGRLTGRGAELAQLRSALDDALGGRPRLTMVVGEPGIGKTRLVEELAVYAGLRRADVLWGRCYEGEGGVPYLPFVEAFRGYVRTRSDTELREVLGRSAAELSTLVSEIRTRITDVGPLPVLDPEAERLRLFDGVASFVRAASLQAPLVIVLDDLHWADKPSLLLLQYLARNLDRDRVLIVGTYRDVELDRTHPLADAVATLRRERIYDRVLLRGLDLDDVTELLAVASNQAPPPEFAAMVHRETEGNPFFIAEILRHLVDTGAIRREGDQWVGTPEAVLANLPEGVREVIGRRLSHLSADCNALLTVAAAVPQGFHLDVVRAVAGFDEDRALDLLDEALRQHVVQERRDAAGTFEFSHALIRQTLYGELSTPRRIRLHRQIADALEQHYGAATDAHLSELAYHCFQSAPGGDVDRAVSYCVRAAERAVAQAAYEEAERFFDMALQALDLVETPDRRRRCELLTAMGVNCARGGDGARARSTLDEAIRLAREEGDAVLLARAAVSRTGARIAGGIAEPELVALLESALDQLGERDLVLRARLFERLALQHAFVDDIRSMQAARDALRVAEQSGDPGARARALYAWTLTLTGPDTGAEYAEAGEQLDRLAEEVGDVDLSFSAVNFKLVQAMRGLDRDEFDQAVVRATQLAERSRSLQHRLLAVGHEVVDATLAGRYDEVDAALGELLSMGHRLGDRASLNVIGIYVYPSARERGFLARLEEPTRRATTASPEPGWRAGYAHLLACEGKLDEAAVVLDELGAGGFAALPENVARQYAWAAAAEAAALVGARAHARELHDLLLPFKGKGIVLATSAFHGACDRYLGLTALATDDPDGAVQHLDDALRLHRAFRAPTWVARSQYDLGRALLARDDPGDRRAALDLLNKGLESAQSLGMTSLVAEVLAEKLSLQGIADTAPDSSIDLLATAVSIERPDLAPHASDDGTITITFSDIEGSTELTERLGDADMQELLRKHNEVVRRAVAAHGGSEVKTQGDGFMLTFANPASAARCGLEIQQTMIGDVRVRIGMHTGQVIHEEGDYFGRAVILAARVAAAAAGGEVLASEAVRAALEPAGFEFDAGRSVSLKGLSGTHVVSRLLGPPRR